MMGYTILITAPYILPVFDQFRGLFESAGLEIIVVDVKERLEEERLLEYAGMVDGTICGDDRYSAAVLEKFSPRLKVISKWGTGIDSIDQQAARALGIKVCNTPGAFIYPVADSVLEYLLLFARRGPWMDREMKSGLWEKQLGRALFECALGVVGVGNIGKAVLRRARAFGMVLYGNDIVEIDPAFIAEFGVEMISLGSLLARSDFISINCDLNPTSYHLINRSSLAHAKRGAILINTARGPIVEEDALIEALHSGALGGAALDVFEQEPLPLSSPLLQMENVFLAPHNSNSSPTAWEYVHHNTIRNLFDGLGISHNDHFQLPRLPWLP